MTSKDLKYLSWCNKGAELFSTCTKRQYMSMIVAMDSRVISTGYNGVPEGMKHCTDGGCPRALMSVPPGSDYSNCYSVHCEVNAIMRANYTDLFGATLYVNGQPCWDCAKVIANSGIMRIVFLHDPDYIYVHQEQTDALFEAMKIELIPITKEELL